jgi:regulator of protease activity HflC (stomatin/prohibitin superfamily)
MTTMNVALEFLLLLMLIAVVSSIHISKEYERGVVFRLGRLIPLKGPGLFLVIPGVDRVTKVDLRVVTHVVPPQDVITSDNVSVKVNAVIFFQVMDAQAAIASLHADPARYGIEPELDHRLSDSDRVDPAALGGACADEEGRSAEWR